LARENSVRAFFTDGRSDSQKTLFGQSFTNYSCGLISFLYKLDNSEMKKKINFSHTILKNQIHC